MTREQLQAASEALRNASEQTTDSDLQQRLHEQSDQFARLATAERGPDHGRLARHLNVLSEISESLDGDAASLVDDAEEAITAYRETVEGV